MFPQAGIPVVQLSLDYTLSPADHVALAKNLSLLRKRGILILGSGNIVHNLRLVDWKNQGRGHDWAIEASETLKKSIHQGDVSKLAGYKNLGSAVQLAVPTPEHFLPLLYVMALREENENITLFNDQCIMGSLSMTSVKIF
jgi:4,5-DOPA dioxygenase extradiol